MDFCDIVETEQLGRWMDDHHYIKEKKEELG